MSRVGHTYTRHFELDTRQHELLGVDLGEGAPRRALIVGLVLFAAWFGGLVLLFGLPGKLTFTAYFVPPVLVSVYGAQQSRAVERRWNMTRWALGIRYLVLGHRPIICGGQRAAARSEWITRRDRWAPRLAFLAESPLGGPLDRWLGPDDGATPGAGAPIRLDSRPRLYGPDAVAKAARRRPTIPHQKKGEQ
ncbi:hypothetical protein [Streptomyces tsukubensis]|uniref:hypothetical protein n=1 Tax=Streptomyces tsukubensis TaxID=83656 RepID=UPI00344C73FD